MHTWVIVRFQQYSIHHSCRDGVYLAIARCFVCMSFRSYYGKSLDCSSSLCRQSLTWAQWGGVINTLWHFDENKMLLNLWPHMCDCDLLSSSRGAAQKNPTQHMHARSKTFVTYYYTYLYEFHKSLIAAQFLSFSGAFTNCWGRGHYEGFRVEPDFVQLYSFTCVSSFPLCAMTECSGQVIFWLCICHVWLNPQKRKKSFFDILNHYTTTQCWSISKAPNNWVRLFGKTSTGVKRRGWKNCFDHQNMEKTALSLLS